MLLKNQQTDDVHFYSVPYIFPIFVSWQNSYQQSIFPFDSIFGILPSFSQHKVLTLHTKYLPEFYTLYIAM